LQLFKQEQTYGTLMQGQSFYIGKDKHSQGPTRTSKDKQLQARTSKDKQGQKGPMMLSLMTLGQMTLGQMTLDQMTLY
jgi:hypothetical protein